MPVQSTTILCPQNQWTAIAPLMDLRTALMVQCPQVLTTRTPGTRTHLDDGTVNTLVAANLLRKSLTVATSQLPAGTTHVSISPSSASASGGGVSLDGAQCVSITELGWNWAIGTQWNWIATGAGGNMITLQFEDETYSCRALILGTVQAPAVAGGPYGSSPPGYWVSSDLSDGPANFRLQKALDGDLTTQEWFAWPVGSISVAVQVMQAFDIPPPPIDDNYATFQFGLPQLSAAGKFHLDSLRRKIDGAAALKIYQPENEP